jgi:hypothetical protein
MKRDLSEGANETSRGAGGPTGLFARLERAVQRGFRDLQSPANLRNRVFRIIIQGLSNTQLLSSEGFWSATSSSSGTGSDKACLCPLPNEVSFKLSYGAKDMKDQFSATRCGINVLGQAFKPNPALQALSSFLSNL